MAEQKSTNYNSSGTKKGYNPGMASFSTRPQRMSRLGTNLPKPKVPAGLNRFAPLLVAALICFAAGFGGGLLGSSAYNHDKTLNATSTAAKQQFVSNESELISSIAKTVGQSVVSVNVQTQVSSPSFFGYDQTQNQEAAGTGFIISSDGIIVTNRHVVPEGTTSVSVTLADGTQYDNVQVIGRTANTSSQDIAFLKIPDLKGKNLTPVALGDSSKMQVGDHVIAIGNALGQFQNTVTSGIISGFGRDVTAGDQSGSQDNENLTDLFQTDAAINEGNSGGPLVNINGEVIGINTAIASDAQNIGFAQPINDIKGLVSSVLGGGKIEQPYLGVRYVSLTNDLAKEFNLKVTRGAYVTSGSGQQAVVTDSPADKAGIKDHDVITKVNNITIDDKTSLTAALSRFKVGDKVTLTVVRDGKKITKDATLAILPQQ
jgi:serine protease Do